MMVDYNVVEQLNQGEMLKIRNETIDYISECIENNSYIQNSEAVAEFVRGLKEKNNG